MRTSHGQFDGFVGGIGRRTFLKTAGGLIGVTVLGVSSYAEAQDSGANGVRAAATPGVATQRIEGRAKITGAKIFARDFNARDMRGWGDKQWYALYLCALSTEHAFLGLDLSGLPAEAQPTRTILGDQLKPTMRAPPLRRTRDLMVEALSVAPAAQANLGANGGDFDLPKSVEFDLIVKPGAVPNFLGQGVALLMFDTVARYRAAKRFLRFRDSDFQIYTLDSGPSTGMGKAYSPKTLYVKYHEEGKSFDYATADPGAYTTQAATYQGEIGAFLAKHPEFIKQDIAVDTQAMEPMFMEPETGLAYYDAGRATLNVLLGTQSPDGDVADIASMYGAADAPMKVSEVALTSCYPGGGFGGRDSSPFSLLLALAAAFSDGHPVKLEHDRFEQFRLGLKRPGVKICGALYCGPDMKLKHVQAAMDFNGGGLKNLSPYVANLASLCIGGSYAFPMADISAQSVHTQDIPGGSQRGFGGPEAFLAIETALDDLAASRKWDPIALRRANTAVPETLTVVGGPIAQQLRLDEMLDIAEKHPLWANRDQIKSDYAAKRLTYGVGMAMSLQAYGTSGDGVVAAVFIESNGDIVVKSDAVDMGNGSATTLGVVVGPFLGANAARVEMGGYALFPQTGLSTPVWPNPVDWSDPKMTAKGVGSSSACLTGLHQVHVARQAAMALMSGGVLPAARLVWAKPDLSVDDVAWKDNALTARAGGLPEISMEKIASVIHENTLPRGALAHAYFQAKWVQADYPTPTGDVRLQIDGLSFYKPGASEPEFVARKNTKGTPTAAQRYSRTVWAPCVNVIGLIVDKNTGRVRIENVLSILNAGQVCVPQLVSGQSQGGVAMAIGYALLEDMRSGMAGPANGTWNLDRYHVPRSADVPLTTAYTPGGRAQELILLPETPGDDHTGRGIAEAVMCSIAPAISNALRDATEKRFTSLPITPEKILNGLAS